MIDFGSKVNERYSEFTHSQKMVAGYLMDHPDVAAFCSLQELSERIGVSTTTVIRFARMLDYSGYSDMQKDFQNNIQNKTALPERLENSGGTIPANQLLTKSFALDIQNIQETLSAQNDQDLEAAVNLIASSNKTYIFGMRSSYAMAHYLASRIGEIKDNVRLVQSTGMIYPEEVADATKGDVCIAYLFPRYSRSAASVIAWLRKEGVKVVLITSLNYSAVESYGDIILPCAISSVTYKNSFAATLCLSNYLAAAVADSDRSRARRVLTKVESILNQGCYLGL